MTRDEITKAIEWGRALNAKREQERAEDSERAILKAEIRYKEKVNKIMEGLPVRIARTISRGDTSLTVAYGHFSESYYRGPRPASLLGVLQRRLVDLGFTTKHTNYHGILGLFQTEGLSIDLREYPA